MKKRILAMVMVITMLFGTESVTYAAQTEVTPDEIQSVTNEQQTKMILTADETLMITPDEIERTGEEIILAAPGKLTATATDYQTINVSWETVADASGYTISYGTSAANLNNTIKVENAQTAAYTLTGLACGSTYYIQICAYDALGIEGTKAAAVSAKPILATGKLNSATATGYKSIALNWNAVAGADGYVIYRSKSQTSGYSTCAMITSGKTLSYIDTKASTGIKYYYKIKAYRNVNGAKVYSATDSNIKSAKAALQKVTLKSVTSVNYYTAKLKWSKNTEANGYYVYRATSKKGKYTKIATITKNTTVSYKDKTCTTGKTYYYKVKAYKKISKKKTINSGYSNIVVGTTKVAAPVLSSAKTAAYNKIKLKWNKVSGANGYVIYRSTAKNGSYTKIKTISSAKTLTYTDTKLKTGKKYYYKVKAYRKVSGKKKYGTSSNIKAATPIPASTSSLTVTAKNGKKIALSWKKVAGAQYYVVLRSTSKNGTYKIIKKKTTKLSYTNSGLTANKRYYYKVYAVRNGVNGKQSAAASTTSFNFTLSKTSATIYRGASEKIKASVTGTSKVTWKSANTGIATVDASGRIRARAVGTTTVTAKYRGASISVKVKVTTRIDGIDVSHWQGTINWSAVKAAGMEFVMLKATEGTTYTDPTFDSNYTAAKAAGLKIGCYGFAHATSVDTAVAEANYLVSKLNGKKMSYPVVLDFEAADILNWTDNTTRTDIIFAYKSVIEAAGYKFALYANWNWLTNYIDNSRLTGVDIWIARYSTAHGYTGGGNVTMWQYTSQGAVSGIAGNVDMNYSYKGY